MNKNLYTIDRGSSLAHQYELKGKYITVAKYRQSPGKVQLNSGSTHILRVMLAPQPTLLFQSLGEYIHNGFYKQGDISLIPAGLIADEDWHNEGHYLQISLASEFVHQVAQRVTESVAALQLFPFLGCQDPELLSLCMMLQSELDRYQLGGQRSIEMLAELLAIHLVRHYTNQNPSHAGRAGLTKCQIHRLTIYVQEHLHQDIRLPDLANHVGMSPFHFSRLFKQTLQITPYQYVIQLRIEQAKALLEESTQSIADIALECGFNSQSHMGKWFRQLTGMTPKAYKVRHQTALTS